MAGNTGLTLVGQPSNLNYPGLTPSNGVSVPGTPVFGAPAPATTPAAAATGGGSGVNRALVDASIANTNKSLEQLPVILQSSLDSNNQLYQNAENGFNTQQADQQGQYDKGTVTNQQNYDSNLMAALHAGATGLGGLLSILRGTGAEGWAKQAVGDTTNNDIRAGLTTHDQNQTSLDNGLSAFMTDLAGKRDANKQTLTNNEFAARSQNATQLQDLYTKLAGYYADAGDTATATEFLNKAGDQTAEIARYGTAPVAAFDNSKIPVQAAPITAFAGPTQQNVTSSETTAPNAGIFTISDTRKKLAGA